MTVRNMSAQPHKFFVANWSFETATMKSFKRISLDLSSPKAEVRGSNPFGRAIKTESYAQALEEAATRVSNVAVHQSP